jgi:hypothetical protein
MSVVSLLGVEVKNNPAAFDAPYEFEITFECLEQLQKGAFIHIAGHDSRYELSMEGVAKTFMVLDSSNSDWLLRCSRAQFANNLVDLEWKLTYVGSATS